MPQPTAVWVIARRLVCKGSDDFDMVLAICSAHAKRKPENRMSTPLYVLILAGGSGERFWPLSRKTKPKQLLSLFSEETLLEATLRRLEGLVPAEQILILTNSDQEAAVRALCPDLPPENIIAEPA